VYIIIMEKYISLFHRKFIIIKYISIFLKKYGYI
jgi:hypothetical protein